MYKIDDISLIYLGIIAFVVILLASYLLLWRRNTMIKYIGQKIVNHFTLMSRTSWWIKSILLAIGVFLLFVAASNPRWGYKEVNAINSKADIFIAFDISHSMMAEDIKPSRLLRAQKWATDLTTALKANRLGLIYFAGESHLQVPLTSDYAAVQFALRGAHPNLAGTQGTNISETITKTQDSFVKGEMTDRVLIIISDGEEHEQEALEIAKKARENQLIIFTVGVGTENGGFVPFNDRGRDSYKKDKEGNPVISRFNRKMLKDLASEGGGSFYMVDQGQSAIDDIKNKIIKYQKESKEKEIFTEKESYFQYFLGAGMLFLLLSWIIPIRNK